MKRSEAKRSWSNEPRLGELALRQRSRNVDFAENFEDLKIWQRARALANEVYDAMEKCRDFDFRSQSQREACEVEY